MSQKPSDRPEGAIGVEPYGNDSLLPRNPIALMIVFIGQWYLRHGWGEMSYHMALLVLVMFGGMLLIGLAPLLGIRDWVMSDANSPISSQRLSIAIEFVLPGYIVLRIFYPKKRIGPHLSNSDFANVGCVILAIGFIVTTVLGILFWRVL